MKKMRFITLALVVAVMLIGAGYAAWTDTVVIDSTVNTGQLDVNWVNDGAFNSTQNVGNVYTASTTKTDANTITITLSNLYPGAETYWDGVISNDGDIPVKFESAELIFDDPDNELIPYLKAMCTWHTYPGIDGNAYNPGTYHNPWFALDQLDDKLNGDTRLLEREIIPGGTLHFGDPEAEEPECIRLLVDENAPDEVTEEIENLTFTLELTFKQWNL